MTALRHQPDLVPGKVAEVAELLARLVLSEVVQPTSNLSTAITSMTEMITGFLTAARQATAHSGAA
jgi:hypothetical protein